MVVLDYAAYISDFMVLCFPTAVARQTDRNKHSGVGARAQGQLGKQVRLIDSIHSSEHRPRYCFFLFPSRDIVTSSPLLSLSQCLSLGLPPPLLLCHSALVNSACGALLIHLSKKVLLSVSLWRRKWNGEARDGGKFSAFTFHFILCFQPVFFFFDGQDDSP